MPCDIALHPLGNPVAGNHPPAPPLPVRQSITGLAEGAPSADIVVPAPGGVLVLTATAKLRADLQISGTALVPATSAVVLVTDQPRMFSLPPGTYKVQTAVYA